SGFLVCIVRPAGFQLDNKRSEGLPLKLAKPQERIIGVETHTWLLLNVHLLQLQPHLRRIVLNVLHMHLLSILNRQPNLTTSLTLALLPVPYLLPLLRRRVCSVYRQRSSRRIISDIPEIESLQVSLHIIGPGPIVALPKSWEWTLGGRSGGGHGNGDDGGR
ncbi:hypothetical protein NEOLEDRAFT_1199145, partial [Neolentinus lepideus HHB14362 ss-1]